MPDREYIFPVRLVVGTDEPLTREQRAKLVDEVNATLAVHLDIPGTLRFAGNAVNGGYYVRTRGSKRDVPLAGARFARRRPR